MNLIDKDALVAEIEKLMNRYDSEYDEDSTEVNAAKGNVCHEILCTIDTLEVKEVDLEKEVMEYMDNEMKFLSDEVGYDTLLTIAKHFFELGFMYTLSWKDIRLIAEIGEEFMNSEESDAYTNDESYYNAILNKLKEKGLDYKTQRQEMRDIKALKGE